MMMRVWRNIDWRVEVVQAAAVAVEIVAEWISGSTLFFYY